MDGTLRFRFVESTSLVAASGLASQLVLAGPLDTTFDIGNFRNPTSITNQYWPLTPGKGAAHGHAGQHRGRFL